MAKRAKLKDALDRQRGVDHKLEQQRRQEKRALKRKREQQEVTIDEAGVQSEEDDAEIATVKKSKKSKQPAGDDASVSDIFEEVVGEEDAESGEDDDEEWDTADSDIMHTAIDLSRLQDSDTSDSEEEDDQDGGSRDEQAKLVPKTGAKVAPTRQAGPENGVDEDEQDIPLSDIESLASEDKADVIPHQRLTINNIDALTKAWNRIALPTDLPFSTTQAIISEQPTEIPDIDDDLKRESAFYKQSLDAVTRARALLKKEGVPFARPADYFAEMVKTDEHMGKIKKKLVDDAAGKKAAAEARRQRDLKKFGKQVQIAKLQERAKEKRTTLDQIKMLKRKRSGASIGNEKEESMFDVALEDAGETQRKDKAARRASGGGPNAKRQKKNDKYGYGGKKRFSKSNDAESSADTRGFSVKRMKGKTAGKPRLGKSRRTKTR